MRRRLPLFGSIVATIALLLVIASHAFGFYVLSSFREVFATAEWPIPWQTRLVLDTHRYWLLFPLLGAAGYALIFWRRDHRGWYLLVIGVLSVVILLPLTVWAMYLPVLE